MANRTMHDTDYPQCARMKSDEEYDFAMMLSRELTGSRIERNVRMLKVKLPDGSSSTLLMACMRLNSMASTGIRIQ